MRPVINCRNNQFVDKWVYYRSSTFGIKELIILLGQTTIAKDEAAV
ncbi:MAG: hypothetical protein GX946_02280 [Oligosphaeraceae bacterium]|nr:hypothetical protein [Oligosphaeraceae bacterium]